MQFNLDLPDDVVKKIRALNMLTDRDPRAIESTLIGLIDTGVTAEIMLAIGVDQATPATPARGEYAAGAHPVRRHAKEDAPLGTPVDPFLADASGVSAGLGDIDDEAATDPQAMVPAKGGLKEGTVEREDAVSDPEHEAKGAASRTGDGARVQGAVSEVPAEFEMAALIGIEHPPLPKADLKKAGRRQMPKGRAAPAIEERSSF